MTARNSVRLLLVRHAQTTYNLDHRQTGWADPPLSDLGERQAASVAAHLGATEHPAAIYSSPLRRALATAEPIAAALGLPIATDPGLREMSFGECEGLTRVEIEARFPSLFVQASTDERPEFCWPGGETRAEFVARFRAAFGRIAAAHAGETAVVVAHGGLLSAFLTDIVDGRPYAWLARQAHNCSTSEIVLADGGAALVRQDWRGYLNGLADLDP